MTVEDVEGPLAVLEEKCNDSDPRVRTAAFEALVRPTAVFLRAIVFVLFVVCSFVMFVVCLFVVYSS